MSGEGSPSDETAAASEPEHYGARQLTPEAVAAARAATGDVDAAATLLYELRAGVRVWRALPPAVREQASELLKARRNAAGRDAVAQVDAAHAGDEGAMLRTASALARAADRIAKRDGDPDDDDDDRPFVARREFKKLAGGPDVVWSDSAKRRRDARTMRAEIEEPEPDR